MTDFICQRCEDTGRITVRNRYPMSYVCAGDPPDYARGITGARCRWCDPIARWQEECEDE